MSAESSTPHRDQLAKWCGYHGLIPPTGEVVDAFVAAMGDNQYGVEETWDAFCWFRSGFNAAGAKIARSEIARPPRNYEEVIKNARHDITKHPEMGRDAVEYALATCADILHDLNKLTNNASSASERTIALQEALLRFLRLRTDAPHFVHDFSLACGVADALIEGRATDRGASNG